MTTAQALSPIDAPPTGRPTVTQSTPVIGAEIAGVDLRQPIDRALRDALYAPLLRHKVPFFHDQDIRHDRQPDFARNFGTAA